MGNQKIKTIKRYQCYPIPILATLQEINTKQINLQSSKQIPNEALKQVIVDLIIGKYDEKQYNKLSKENIREDIQKVIYDAIER